MEKVVLLKKVSFVLAIVLVSFVCTHLQKQDLENIEHSKEEVESLLNNKIEEGSVFLSLN